MTEHEQLQPTAAGQTLKTCAACGRRGVFLYAARAGDGERGGRYFIWEDRTYRCALCGDEFTNSTQVVP
jgi:DNA-directed RNA polymerase subunit RPC12/RpoP